MNILVEKGVIKEKECGNNFAYILENDNCFLSTEYKVLQSQNNSSIVKCMKMTYNGKIELYYNLGAFKSFDSIISKIDADGFLKIVANIFSGIIDIKNNGFLNCNNIDSSFEHIYVDTNTYKVGLIYLPLSVHEYSDDATFENALRTNLIRTINETVSLNSEKTRQLSSNLQNVSFSIERLYSSLGGRYIHSPNNNANSYAVKNNCEARLVSTNIQERIEFVINKGVYTIGKKDTNDGIISFNKMISRNHCKITNINGQFEITDLQSANGTFVNGRRAQENQGIHINDGDCIRLANIDFQFINR